jgi:hypothetical protein
MVANLPDLTLRSKILAKPPLDARPNLVKAARDP